MDHKVFLSKRNIQTLLNKLDRNKLGEGGSACTIIKCDNQHAKYPQTMVECAVTAVEGIKELAENDDKISSSQIFISRAQLETLLKGDNMMFAIGPDKKFTSDVLIVTPLEDKEYYSTRAPGEVHHLDDPGMKR